MQYSPQNENGLMSLLAGLESGLDPSIAYSVLQEIQGDQQAQLQQRQERQSGLIGMLGELAMSGMPYAGAEAMLDAAPGPMGPALDSALATLYPNGGPPPTNASGAVMDFPVGSGAREGAQYVPQGIPGPAMQNFVPSDTGPTAGPQATSPAFQSAPVPFAEQQAMMEMEQQAALDADLTGLQADAAKRKSQNWTVDQFIAEAQKNNPELFASAPEEVEAIISMTFGPAALETRGVPNLG